MSTVTSHWRCQTKLLGVYFTPTRNVWNRPKPILPLFKEHKITQRRKREKLENRGIYVKDLPNPSSMTYNEDFAKVTSFESQMKSLAQRGFQRSWRPYSPTKNMEGQFVTSCQKAFGDKWESLGSDFSKIKINGASKVRLLSTLAEDFGGHRVPNSMLHTMTSLDKVFSFYSTKVTENSPYDLLEQGVMQGVLPQNLHVQIEPVRFDPTTSSSELGQVSAFPRTSNIFSSPEARKKWVPYQDKRSPYRNSEDDDDF